MVFRVAVGAALSTIDAITDIYVITTYYDSDELVQQANALLVMIMTNLIVQILQIFGLYNQRSWKKQLKEIMICILFLRPAVDAYVGRASEAVRTKTRSERRKREAKRRKRGAKRRVLLLRFVASLLVGSLSVPLSLL